MRALEAGRGYGEFCIYVLVTLHFGSLSNVVEALLSAEASITRKR